MAALARVLVLSVDATLGWLVEVNLTRRGLAVRQHHWAACCGLGETPPPDGADLVVADLDCPSPGCWRGATQLRVLFPRRPLLLLAHDRPSAPYLQACQPCRSVQKPFAVDELIGAVGALLHVQR